MELPAFSTLLRAVRRVRTAVHRDLFARVTRTLTDDHRAHIDALFVVNPALRTSPWQALKRDPGRPTLTTMQRLLDRLEQLNTYSLDLETLTAVPVRKLHHFAAEAESLDAARMQDVEPHKRYALIAAFLAVQTAAARDDLATLLIRRMRSIHKEGKADVLAFHAEQQPQAEVLIATLRDVLVAAATEGPPATRIAAIDAVIGERGGALRDQCDRQLAYAGNRYLPFLIARFRPYRAALLRILRTLTLRVTTQDAGLTDGIHFLLAHARSKRDTLLTEQVTKPEGRIVRTPLVELSWVPDGWWRFVTGTPSRGIYPKQIDRRAFEICVCTHVWWSLQSGNLAVVGSDLFADFGTQLISWEAYHAQVVAYGDRLGFPVEGSAFVAHLQARLATRAHATDQALPTNVAVRIEAGEPVVRPTPKQPEPALLAWLEATIRAQITPVGILDTLRDTEHWLNWTRCFGPISGHDGKLKQPTALYLATVLCYGCVLGPSQTARALAGVDRRDLAWAHQRHVTEARLDEAIRVIVNAYNRFALPKYWGSGKRASADGTQWDLYEQNLLAERHIRYGGYGGIGYYHVSDTYIALFSHFIPCGVWEAIYILDGLINNESDIQPDTIHADTQGQSETVFGLAYLLGITLMPRIRGWKHLQFYRPTATSRYEHLDSLFTATADWALIATHLPDMLRVALSVRAGTLAPSTILRRLGTYSRQNPLFQAFRALGRVVRTEFLLTYLADETLRVTIHAATNKNEAFNNFIQWVGFGSQGVIPSNDRAEQRKLVKYMHLVANCVIFHNVQAVSQILHTLQHTGEAVPPDAIGALSPYLTEHVNRLGTYTLDLAQIPSALNYDLLQPQPTTPNAVQQALWSETR
jgi:TnpA family transposase